MKRLAHLGKELAGGKRLAYASQKKVTSPPTKNKMAPGQDGKNKYQKSAARRRVRLGRQTYPHQNYSFFDVAQNGGEQSGGGADRKRRGGEGEYQPPPPQTQNPRTWLVQERGGKKKLRIKSNHPLNVINVRWRWTLGGEYFEERKVDTSNKKQ